jgi:AraC-like DNA-binding protein
MNITSIPALLGIFALAFLLLLLAKVIKQPAADKPAKALLILLLTGMSSMAFCLFYIYAGMYQYWPRLASIEIGLSYWIGPSLYFYLRRITGGANPFADPRNLLHWAPALVIELALLPFFLRPLPEAVPMGGYSGVLSAIWWGFHLQLATYIILCQPYLHLYRQRLVDNYSALSLLNLRWLQLCCYGFIVLILAERLLPALHLTSSNLSQAAGMTVYLLIIALAYSALGQSRLQFTGGWQPAPVKGKYTRSGLRDDSAQYYLDKLNQLMASERYYLESDLSLQALADRVRMSPHHLSQMLNDKLGKTFYDYINEQRVSHAKRLLLDQPAASITDIAFDSGFNSKNSFYNAFKRHGGMSPSGYRHQHRSTTESDHTEG